MSGYTITYKKAGINASGNVAAASGKKKITLLTPKREGFTFLGWYTDKERENSITSIKKGNSRNYTLYAKWKKTEEGEKHGKM